MAFLVNDFNDFNLMMVLYDKKNNNFIYIYTNDHSNSQDNLSSHDIYKRTNLENLFQEFSEKFNKIQNSTHSKLVLSEGNSSNHQILKINSLNSLLSLIRRFLRFFIRFFMRLFLLMLNFLIFDCALMIRTILMLISFKDFI